MRRTLKKYMSNDYWQIPLAFLVLAIIFYLSVYVPRDKDFLYMVATGEYIVKNGFPYTNPFFIKEGYGMVVQQWIPCVLVYFGWTLAGWQFLKYQAMAGLTLLVYAIYKNLSLNNPKPRALLTAAILTIPMVYLYQGRPMLYSMILILFQLYICEKKGSLWYLPLIVLIEANIHASFIAFHFVYLLPYIVPGITKMLKNTAEHKYIKALPLMAAAAFINPYGADGALYLIKSMQLSDFPIPIAELETFTPKICAWWLTLAWLLFILVQIYRKHIRPKKKIDSSKFYAFAGSLLLLILFPQIRNYVFVLIGSIPLISTMLPKAPEKAKSPSAKLLWIVAVCVLVWVMPATYNHSIEPEGLPINSAEYLKGKNSVLFNVFDDGCYFELNGIKCFTDSRPELLFRSINSKDDADEDMRDMYSEDNEKINAVIEKYGFTHFYVYETSEIKGGDYLYKYLSGRCREAARDGDCILLELERENS